MSCPNKWFLHKDRLPLWALICFFNLFYCCSIIVVCIFSPPQPNLPPSPVSTLPLGFAHVSFIVVPENRSPYYPFPRSPLAFVGLLLTSMSPVIFCLLLLLLIRFQLKVSSDLNLLSLPAPVGVTLHQGRGGAARSGVRQLLLGPWGRGAGVAVHFPHDGVVTSEFQK